jgi:hypothetical protein
MTGGNISYEFSKYGVMLILMEYTLAGSLKATLLAFFDYWFLV